MNTLFRVLVAGWLTFAAFWASISWAQFPPPPIGGVVAGKITGSYQTGNGATNTWSFTASTFGTAAANRYIVVVWGYSSAQTITTTTIGGISASQVLAFASGTQKISMFIAPVPTNSSLALVSNGSGTGTVVYAVYALLSYNAAAAATTFTGTSISQTPAIPQGSFAIAGLLTTNGTGTLVGVTPDASPTVGLDVLQVGSHQFVAGLASYSIGTSGGTLPAAGVAIFGG